MVLAPPRREAPGVAEVLRSARDQSLISDRLHPQQRKVLHRICVCRTAALGGHADLCLDCGVESYSYNSCRDRHCPRCQWRAQEQWIEGQLKRLIDTHYFHVVFTLPAQLRPLAARNPAEIYGVLMRTASRTLLELGKTELGATLGVTTVLHTWTRELAYHPHVHCLVTGGGLSLDRQHWRSARTKYLFAVKQMGALFRGKFLAGLRKLFDADELNGIGARHFDELLEVIYRADWVVYAKRPMAGPAQVIKYLGRYTHRVAISNSRIVEATLTHVTFITKNAQHKTLAIGDFARRFLQHVLPYGFTKIRHYGLFASPQKLAMAKQLRPPACSEEHSEPALASVPVCEVCGSCRLRRTPIARTVWARGPPHDTKFGRAS